MASPPQLAGRFGHRTAMKGKVSMIWLLGGAIAPFGGLVARPLVIVGAVMALFGFVVAAIEVRHHC